MSSIFLKDCSWIVTQSEERRVLRGQSVYAEDGIIVEIAPGIRREADFEVDGTGMVLMPGLINLHTHASHTLLRGFADDMELHEWLSERIWPLEARLTGDYCYWGALLACLEMIKSGTTCFLDMCFFMKDVARAVKEAGLRGYLSHRLIDLGDAGRGRKALDESARFAESVKELDSPYVRFVVGPHSIYSCSQELLEKCETLAERYDSPVHIHLAETRKEQAECEAKYGERATQYLEKVGLLNGRLIAAHCVWLSKQEVRLMAEKGAAVARCPISNMKIGVGGVAPVPEMLELGVRVGLGTDGPASNNCLDMFQVMKVFALLHKSYRWDPTILPAQQVLDVATLGGASGLRLDNQIGSVEVGTHADLILVDLRQPVTTPVHGASTVTSHLVYSMNGSQVNCTFVDGRPLMVNRKVVVLDEDDVLEKAQEMALRFVQAEP